MSNGSKRRKSTFGAGPSFENLRRRASLLERCRRFFSERGILEVETPLLSAGVLVEAHVDPIACSYRPEGARAKGDGVRLYLRSSPEAAMKRLLAAGSGPIYQFARAFREGERGRLHSPEFTILEWYRPDYDHHEMMEEVGELMTALLGISGWKKRTYRELFEEIFDVDPLNCPTSELAAAAERHGIPIPMGLDEGSRNGWLDLLLVTCVEPRLGNDVPTFVYDYPPSQAAFAKIGGVDQPVAERFELYIKGVEICNGFHELVDIREHRLRFEDANVRRAGMGKPELPVDQDFLAALETGLPPCSGVAVGFDRVAMLACGAESIDEVVAFPFDDQRGDRE